MTRRIVYGISLWVFLAATALTFTAIALPNWISYTSPTTHDPIRVSYGLHKRCTNIPSGPAQLQTSGTRCTSFPQYEDCHGEDRYFCSIWRTTGFLMNFAVVLELASLVGFAVVILGGRGKREAGWQILSGVIGLVAAAQMIAMALVVCASCGSKTSWHVLTVRSAGFPLRPRQPLLCRLGARQVVDSLHRQLGCYGA